MLFCREPSWLALTASQAALVKTILIVLSKTSELDRATGPGHRLVELHTEVDIAVDSAHICNLGQVLQLISCFGR